MYVHYVNRYMNEEGYIRANIDKEDETGWLYTVGWATRSTISTSGVHIVLRNHSLPITFFWTARLLVDIEGMFKIIC